MNCGPVAFLALRDVFFILVGHVAIVVGFFCNNF